MSYAIDCMITLLCNIGDNNISESLLKDIDNLLSNNKTKTKDGEHDGIAVLDIYIIV